MPEIKLKHVVSCSSADNTHTAENLLRSDTFHKWRSRLVGEKQVSVILQFEKEEQIHSIDIGNECSAFVEVLVGHSTSASEQEYEVILATSSFMSPSESKSEKNRNRLRMFGSDKLVKATAEKKWDRAKIVCTQPYNKNMAYGLSFIRFNSPPEKDDPSPSDVSSRVTKLGQFKVKEDDDEDSPSMQPGSLFFSRTSKPQDIPSKAPQTTLSYASAALQGSSSTETSCNSEKQTVKTPPSSTTQKDPSSGKRKFEFNKESTSHAPAKKTDIKESPSRPKESTSQPATKKMKVEPSTAPAAKKSSPPEKPSHKKSPSASQPVEMGRILQGTVFVLSGFQNPFRSDLRDKALEMGAKYRPDWTPDSTHLICAFANTPKYSQVKAAGGTIVRKEWVLDCYKKQQRLPSKKYLMATADSSSESEDDGNDSEEDLPPRPKAPAHRTNTDSGRTNHKNQGSSPPKAKPSKVPVKDEDHEDEKPKPLVTKQEDEFGASTDEEKAGVERKQADGSGSDTEDDLVGPNAGKPVKKEPMSIDDPYAGSTDENTDVEEEAEVDLPIPELPDLFSGKRFFLYGEFPATERKTLQRYITAFNGELEEYMSEKVQFVITSQDWDDSFEEALNENGNLSFVRPRWIYNCNERQKCIPHQPYVVVPQE
ncbi:DNA repair protein XRCC1 [Pelobates fuscus]|uniref:DNA repair protein XRCC1 n=1 Tax=Pelobates fuscus TaxID=191477 RepID=UPI002FE44439